MAIHVFVEVGVGAWVARAEVDLVACPHVGDEITVGEKGILCERVQIAEDAVIVSQRYRFVSEQDADAYFRT